MIPEKKALITLIDECNCVIGGLQKEHHKHFHETYGMFVKGYFFNPKYKLGQWDGKIRFYSSSGQTYIYLLDQIIPIISQLGYKISIADNRPINSVLHPPLISQDFFSNIKDMETDEPIKLRDYQVDGANALLQAGGGIVLAATGSGKTFLNAALAESYGRLGARIITIVPSKDLISQTIEQFEILLMDVGEYSGDKKDINHTHVISTWQALQNSPKILKQFSVLIVDECHGVKAGVLKKLLTEHGSHISHRFGLTGTLPKDATDLTSVFISIGNVKFEISASLLIDRKILSNLNIDIIQFNEDLEEEYKEFIEKERPDNIPNYVVPTYKKWKDDQHVDYNMEREMLQNNHTRSQLIANHILNLSTEDKGNVFCLVNNVSFGKKLSALIPNSKFVYGKDTSETRKEIYDLFAVYNNIVVIATTGIASTGINIKRIFNLVYIDIGKSFIRIIQSIGRGLRKAKDKDHVRVTDISSDFKYGRAHLRERAKYYVEATYPHKKHVVKFKDSKL